MMYVLVVTDVHVPPYRLLVERLDEPVMGQPTLAADLGGWDTPQLAKGGLHDHIQRLIGEGYVCTRQHDFGWTAEGWDDGKPVRLNVFIWNRRAALN